MLFKGIARLICVAVSKATRRSTDPESAENRTGTRLPSSESTGPSPLCVSGTGGDCWSTSMCSSRGDVHRGRPWLVAVVVVAAAATTTASHSQFDALAHYQYSARRSWCGRSNSRCGPIRNGDSHIWRVRRCVGRRPTTRNIDDSPFSRLSAKLSIAAPRGTWSPHVEALSGKQSFPP